MANKTQPTKQSVEDFMAAVEHPVRKANAQEVLALMRKITGEEPVMWGDSLIGFGLYKYKYASGKAGEFFILGLSPRKQNLTLYIMLVYQDYSDYLERLGKHKTGRCCLYINKLADIDMDVLEELLICGWQDMKNDTLSPGSCD